MATIYTSKGFAIICDDDDFEWLNQYKWTVGRSGYATATSGMYTGRSMHRVIMRLAFGMEVDHLNHLRHDNRRSNLRICTHKENMENYIGPRTTRRDEVTGKYWLLRGRDLIGIYGTDAECRTAYREAIHGRTPSVTNIAIPID